MAVTAGIQGCLAVGAPNSVAHEGGSDDIQGYSKRKEYLDPGGQAGIKYVIGGRNSTIQSAYHVAGNWNWEVKKQRQIYI